MLLKCNLPKYNFFSLQISISASSITNARVLYALSIAYCQNFSQAFTEFITFSLFYNFTIQNYSHFEKKKTYRRNF